MILTEKYKNIPVEMKQLPQWVGFMRTPVIKDGKADMNEDGTPRMSKIPVDVHTLSGASSTHASQWDKFDIAVNSIGKTATVKGKSGNIEGVGFVFRPHKATGTGICGIDLDHIIDPNTGEVNTAAFEIIQAMDSYTELSPSGTGVHIYYCGSLHSEWEKKFNGCLGGAASMEMYQEKRYFTVTGNVFGELKPIAEREQQAAEIYKKYAPKPQKKTVTNKPVEDTYTTVLSDDKVIEKASKSKQGAKFMALLGGDLSDYGNDQSRADQALCNILAFWCSGDTKQIDRIFRNSGLMREKWDEKRGTNTYGEITINEAIVKCKEFYDPNYNRTRAVEDFKELLPTGNTTIRAIPNTEPLPQETKIELPELTFDLVKKYKADDIGAAEFFSDMVKSFVCYVSEPKLFRVYDGIKWRDDSPEALEAGNVLMKFVRAVQAIIPPKPEGVPDDWTDEEKETERINKIYRDFYSSLSYTGKRGHLLTDVKKILKKKSTDFDRQPYLFNVKNGTINLLTRKLEPHSPTDYISKSANVAYNPQAKYERFNQFISEVTEGSTELAGALQRALGYSMQGKANEECFFVALGETTRNGKGTLFGAIEDIFGDYGTNISFDTIARTGSKDGSRATPDVARLQGVRFVSCNEPDKGSCFNEALIKQLTGSDPITARPLYGSPLVFKPVFKLFITANSMPTVADNSIFESNRLKIIPFKHHFSEEEQDKHLKDKLQGETAKSAVLNWLLDGYKAYCSLGLGVTQEMKALTAKFQYDNDYIQQYIDSRLILFPVDDRHAQKTTVKAIRSDYESWCSVIGTKALGFKSFKEELEKHGVKIIVSHKQFTIRGIIKSDYDYVEEKSIKPDY